MSSRFHQQEISARSSTKTDQSKYQYDRLGFLKLSRAKSIFLTKNLSTMFSSIILIVALLSTILFSSDSVEAFNPNTLKTIKAGTKLELDLAEKNLERATIESEQASKNLNEVTKELNKAMTASKQATKKT